jgi:hypothetical protein
LVAVARFVEWNKSSQIQIKKMSRVMPGLIRHP